MSFLETTLAIIVAQIPIWFINRYFFKGMMDKGFDKLEGKIIKKVKTLWGERK